METIGRDLREMQRVPLAPSHVAAIRDAGTVVDYPASTFLVQPGDPSIASSMSRMARSRW